MAYTRPPDKLNSIMDALYKQLHFDRVSEEYLIIKMWKEIAGAYIAKASQVEKIYQGILYVKVKNAAWRNELMFKKENIIEKMNQQLGKDAVKDIIFK
jgi:predicted nucleic acid-binding Zn ribbon protein